MGEIGKLLGRGRSAEIYALGKDRVIKLFNDNTPTGLVDREFMITASVARAGIPVPMPLERMELLLRPGIIYQRIQGRLLSTELLLKPWDFSQQFIRLAELHSDIHSHTIADLPDQREEYHQLISQADINPQKKLLLYEVLKGLPGGVRVCHGDFHPENIMVTSGERIIIDWMNGTKGTALADVARTVMILRLYLPRPLQWGVDIYLKRYGQIFPYSGQELSHWLQIVAAARLSEGIARERERLLRWLNL